MPREAPEIRLIRETLEGVLHPSTASTVFFEALQDAGGTLPTEHRDVLIYTDEELLERRHLWPVGANDDLVQLKNLFRYTAV